MSAFEASPKPSDTLPAEDVRRVCVELCRTAGRGRPDHPALIRDVESAAYVALNSRAFREAINRAQIEDAKQSGDDEQLTLRRAKHCVDTLLTAFRQAVKHGGKDAKVHAGDILNVVELFQNGSLDHGAPVTGPIESKGVH